MTYKSKTRPTETGNFDAVKKSRQSLRVNSSIALVVTAVLLAGLSGAFSWAACAQETVPNISSRSDVDLSRMVVVGDSLSAGF